MVLHLREEDLHIKDSHRRTFYRRVNSQMDILASYFINTQNEGQRTFFNARAQRYVFIGVVIFMAFVLNTIIGRLLEMLKNFIQRRINVQHDDSDLIVMVFGLVFELINLIFTALLSWEVYSIACKVLQDQEIIS